MIFKKQAEEDFNIQAAEFPEMESLINRCANIYRGVPEWLDDKNNIKTINFAKSVCSETARLATLAIGIQIDGSARATWLQEQIDKVYFQIRHWVEYGCAYGTVFICPISRSVIDKHKLMLAWHGFQHVLRLPIKNRQCFLLIIAGDYQ